MLASNPIFRTRFAPMDRAVVVTEFLHPGNQCKAYSAAKKIPQITPHIPSDSSRTSRIACPSLSRDIGSPLHPDDGDDNPCRVLETLSDWARSIALFLVCS